MIVLVSYLASPSPCQRLISIGPYLPKALLQMNCQNKTVILWHVVLCHAFWYEFLKSFTEEERIYLIACNRLGYITIPD